MMKLRTIPAEAFPGIALLAAAAAAMVIVNSPLGPAHQALLKTPLGLGFGDGAISMPLSGWVKNALMAVFFFFAGLELKRELREGALASPASAMLTLAGAVGGMALPALLYLAIAGSAAPSGWAIPAATDIAFALGVLALLGSRVPIALKAFLLAVAVVDDLGAILIVAFVYTEALDFGWLAWAGAWSALLLALNVFGVGRLGLYALGAIPLWIALQNSGLNPTIAGVVAASAVPLKHHSGRSPLHEAEHGLRPYVLFGVMPLFALATAGAPLGGGLASALTHPAALGIAAGLAIGKPLGIAGMTLIVGRLAGVALPGSPLQILGIGCIAGVGFTMSLFVGSLAFADPAMAAPVRIGVYLGSTAAALAGLTLLMKVLPKVSTTASTPATDPSRPFIAAEERRER